jgi:hypothetical protein
MKPWEKYQNTELEGPWSKYQEPNEELSNTINQSQPKEQFLDKTISQRPDIYGEAVKSLQNLPRNTFESGKLGMPYLGVTDALLKSIGGITQRGEAAIANPFLRKNGQFQNPITAIKEGITGEQLGEIGDIGRQSGLPEPLSAIMGLSMTGGIAKGLSKISGLNSKINNLNKIETTYGKDIGRNVIRQTTQLPMPLVERGMKKGWKKILTKENAKDLELPTKLSQKALDSLDEIAQKEYDEFGKVLNRVKSGNVKAVDLNQVIENTLLEGGYVDETYTSTLKTRGSVVNEVVSFVENAIQRGIKPQDNISIDVIQALKKKLRSFVPEKNWIGKNRSLTDEQKVAKTISQKLDNLIAYNSYGIEDEVFTKAKARYSEFKNFEKAILDRFSEVSGQEVRATADRVIGLSRLQPSAMIEEINKLNYIDDFLKSKGYGGISDKLLDWLTTQNMLVNPEGGIFKRFTVGPGEYITRQFLKSGLSEPIGRGVETIGKALKPVRETTSKYSNIKIPTFLRTSNQLQNQSR